MKLGGLAAFEKHLKGAAPGHFAPCYLILSKENFERKEAEALALRYLGGGGSVKSFSGEKLQPSLLMDELNTFGMFEKRRPVLVEDAEKINKGLQEALLKYLEKPNSGIFLILSANGLKRNTALYKKAEAHGIVVDFPEIKPWQKEKMMAGWLQEQAGKKKKSLDPAACRLLLGRIGTDQELLMRELEKLACYAGDRTAISAEDVAALCASVNGEDVWKFGEAVFQKNGPSAMRIGKALLFEESGGLLGFLRQLRSQFQTELQVAAILAAGGGREEVSAQFPYMTGFILDRHVQMARGYGLEMLKRGILLIDQTELKAKSSAADPECLLELLVAKLT